jgi:hypothetical protein
MTRPALDVKSAAYEGTGAAEGAAGRMVETTNMRDWTDATGWGVRFEASTPGHKNHGGMGTTPPKAFGGRGVRPLRIGRPIVNRDFTHHRSAEPNLGPPIESLEARERHRWGVGGTDMPCVSRFGGKELRKKGTYESSARTGRRPILRSGVEIIWSRQSEREEARTKKPSFVRWDSNRRDPCIPIPPVWSRSVTAADQSTRHH